MIENRNLLLPYVAPYFGYVCLASFLHGTAPAWLDYILRIVLVSGLLAWGWKWFIPFSGPKNTSASFFWGFIYGVIGCALWVLLLSPFVDQSENTPWSSSSVVLRMLAAGFLVPLFEELMIRGYAFRLALQWDICRTSGTPAPLSTALHDRSINDVAPGQWSWPAIIISTLVFMIGHAFAEWPAAIGYGLLICHLLIWRKDLISCIVAHSTTNILLALYVYSTKSWFLW